MASGGDKHHVEQRHGVFHITLEVERAELWDEKLEVVSENTIIQIWVNSAFFHVFYRVWLMGIHPHHSFCDFKFILFSTKLALNVDPLLKPFNEGLLGDSFGLFAANTTAEQIVEAATRFPGTTRF